MQQKFTLYYKIMESIREDILNGVYPIGGLIPTENELEEKFQVSKITIRKAIELLEQDGYVKKKGGYGTTVISNSIYNKLSKGESFSSILHNQDLKIEKKYHSMQKIKLSKEADNYQYFGNASVLINRSYILNGSPYIFMQHFLPKEVKLENSIDDVHFSIYMYLYRNNYIINRFEDYFFTTTASKDIAQELKVALDAPLLGRKRLTYDANNMIIEVSFAYYNTKLHPYQINYSV